MSRESVFQKQQQLGQLAPSIAGFVIHEFASARVKNDIDMKALRDPQYESMLTTTVAWLHFSLKKEQVSPLEIYFSFLRFQLQIFLFRTECP